MKSIKVTMLVLVACVVFVSQTVAAEKHEVGLDGLSGDVTGRGVVQVKGIGSGRIDLLLNLRFANSMLTATSKGQPWMTGIYLARGSSDRALHIDNFDQSFYGALESIIAEEVKSLYERKSKSEVDFEVKILTRNIKINTNGPSSMAIFVDRIEFQATAPHLGKIFNGKLRATLRGELSKSEEENTASATIDKNGSVVGVRSTSGEELVLTIPAGATDLPFDIKITALERLNSLAKFRIESQKTDFLKPIEIRVTLPEISPSTGMDVFSLGIEGARAVLPTSTNVEGNTFSAMTTTLARPIAADVNIQESQTVLVAENATFASTSEVNDALDDGTGLFTDLELDQLDCLSSLGSLHERLLAVQSLSFSSVSQAALLIKEIEALQQCALDPSPVVEAALAAEMELAQGIACQIYADGKLTFSSQIANNVTELRASTTAFLSGVGMREATAATCPTPPVDLRAFMDERYTDFVDRYSQVVSNQLLSGLPWRTLWAQLNEVDLLLYDAAVLELSQADAAVRGTMIPAMLTAFRLAAYRTCTQDQTQQHLADLASGGALYGHSFTDSPLIYPEHSPFSEADIVGDIQRCGSSITVKSFDGTEQLDTAGYIAPEWPAEAPPTPGRLALPLDGAIQIDGSVLALRCYAPNGSVTIGDDELVVRLNDIVVARRSHLNGTLPSSLIDLNADELFSVAGIEPQVGESYMLTIHREGAACGVVLPENDGLAQFYGPVNYELYRVELQIDDEVQGLVFVESASLHNIGGCYVRAVDSVGTQVHDFKPGTTPPVSCEATSGGTASATINSTQNFPTIVVGQSAIGNTLSFAGQIDIVASAVAVFPNAAFGSVEVGNRAEVRYRVGTEALRLTANAAVEGVVSDNVAIVVAEASLEVLDANGARVSLQSAQWYIKSSDPLPLSFTEDINLEPGWSVRVRMGAYANSIALYSYGDITSFNATADYLLNLNFEPL